MVSVEPDHDDEVDGSEPTFEVPVVEDLVIASTMEGGGGSSSDGGNRCSVPPGFEPIHERTVWSPPPHQILYQIPPIPAKRTMVPSNKVEDVRLEDGFLGGICISQDMNDEDDGEGDQFNGFDWEAFIDGTQFDNDDSHKLGVESVLDTQFGGAHSGISGGNKDTGDSVQSNGDNSRVKNLDPVTIFWQGSDTQTGSGDESFGGSLEDGRTQLDGGSLVDGFNDGDMDTQLHGGFNFGGSLSDDGGALNGLDKNTQFGGPQVSVLVSSADPGQDMTDVIGHFGIMQIYGGEDRATAKEYVPEVPIYGHRPTKKKKKKKKKKK